MSGGLRLLFYDPIFENLIRGGGGGGGKDNVHSALVEVNKNFGITSESLFLQVLR